MNAWNTCEPPDGKFVLVKCPSGYSTTPWVYTTACKQREFRGGDWTDHADDRLSDWGMEPVAWTELPADEAAKTSTLSKAAIDVLAERERQVGPLRMRAERDDRYVNGELAGAAAAYATPSVQPRMAGQPCYVPMTWPTTWSLDFWWPSDKRRNLVKAGALILAEIERLDRAAQKL